MYTILQHCYFNPLTPVPPVSTTDHNTGNLVLYQPWDPHFFFWTLNLRLKESKGLPQEKLEGKPCCQAG